MIITQLTVLAIFIPVIAILSIITICSIVYCCRKWRNRALVKGFRNFSAYGPNMIGSTLDRKAMLETSSDNSDPLRSHISYDGPGITTVCYLRTQLYLESIDVVAKVNIHIPIIMIIIINTVLIRS
ncbi:hypothetical protein BLA29_011676 [Euroglyphus maynei]|uniref:Uncharacterized protein n=1 Tax=Euroglyphus maynei TaxID=6958 RepID=A0A1Y3BFP6_EURMA|nr:hypothetical protein BLA29_011676 [Euroglyphus maynei]